jgi:hypothetical protein
MNEGHHKIPPIPEVEDCNAKEVYAFFGLCSYYAQVLEQSVVNLAVGLHVRRLTALTTLDVSDIFDRANQKTLGQLLQDIQQKVQIPDDAERSLLRALKDRNHLFHRFFVEHDIDHGSGAGRRKMIVELQKMLLHFQETDRLVDAIWIPLWGSLGLTQELMEAEIRQMHDEADRRNTSN